MKRDSEAPTVVDREAGRPLADADVARLRDSIRPKPEEETLDGRFALVGEAGTGGMGIVYEAIDKDAERRVAIKVITGLPSPSDRARFEAEAEALERLDHPAIVDYVHHGTTARGEPYLAMEWLTGESLSARLARGPLTVAETATLGERIADALVHAHAAGIVHRDLKPSNIFLLDGKVEQAHVIDFGVAKLANRDLTQTGQMIGTPGYMAPEQVRGDKHVDAAADLFALGCVLYKALTNKAAFDGAEVMEVLARLLLEHPQPVDELVPEVPPRFAHLIASLLAKDPTQRLRDTALARDELRAIRDALAGADTVALDLRPEAVPVPPAPAAAKRSARWPIVLAAGFVVAALIAITLVVASRARPACTETERAACAALCDDGDGAACRLHARTLHENEPKDHEAARVADRRACSLGNQTGCVELARSLLDTAKRFPAGDRRRAARLDEAAPLLVAACDRSDAEACRMLGYQLSRGWGMLPPDPPRAFALVEKSCVLGLVKGCRALLDMIDDADNGGTPALRAHARDVYDDACGNGIVPCLR